MNNVPLKESPEIQQIRDAVRALCVRFPGEYWREKDRARAYPSEFVQALTEAGYLTSTTALDLKELPRSLIVLGANAVGLELAQIYARAGTYVTVLELLPRIAPFEDEEVSDTLTGNTVTYLNYAGAFGSAGDTEALPADAKALNRPVHTFREMGKQATAAAIITGISKKSTAGFNSIACGEITPATPNTRNKLRMQLPTTFPMAMSRWPRMAAMSEVASSGIEVPPATTVSPMTSSLTPINFAISVAASTNRLVE